MIKPTLILGGDCEITRAWDKFIADPEYNCVTQTDVFAGRALCSTVGLTVKGWPELCVSGLPNGGRLLTKIAKGEVKPEAGATIEGVANFPLRFDKISDDALVAIFTSAIAYQLAHGHYEVEGLQVVYPDALGRWPEDEGFDPECGNSQPMFADWKA